MSTLWEKYRPQSWDALLGQDKAKEKIELLKTRGLGGRAFFISGPSGVGKSTIAYLLAAEIAGPDFVQEFDAAEITPAALKKLEQTFSLYSWDRGKTGRVAVINECHGLRKDAIRQLLVFLERLPSHAMICFTTTTENMDLFEDATDASPLLSRCVKLQLTSQGLCKPFAEKAKQIAMQENLDGAPVSKYETLVKECRNNFRAVLVEIESGRMKQN